MKAASLALLLAACGDDGHDVEPRVIPGGGIGDPGVDGEINVHVIDEDTDEPIASATVHVGDLQGETDADGLFVAAAEALSGPQIITVLADGYPASTWYGAAGANVTVPLGLADPAAIEVPTATVTGTIDGWASMEPPSGAFLLALVGYTATSEDDDPANELAQPDGEANLCFKAAGGTDPCAWSLLTRTGPQMVYALIGHATPDPGGGGPTITITDFAYATGVDLGDGDDQTGVTLALAARADLETPDVTLPSAPAGTDTVAALARLNLGAEGRLQLPLTGEVAAPAPKTSLFDGSDYELIGFAGNDLAADPDASAEAQSYRINRGLASLDGAALGSLLALPTAVATDGAGFSFAAVDGATLHVIEVRDADDVGAWTAVILDGAVEVQRPEEVALPDGTLTYNLQALEIPDVDLQDFSIDAIEDTVTRASGDGVEFAN